MIDSLLKYEFPQKVLKVCCPHISWLLSASRDRKIALWKLVDGKIMTKLDYTQAVVEASQTNSQQQLATQNAAKDEETKEAVVNDDLKPESKKKREKRTRGRSGIGNEADSNA